MDNINFTTDVFKYVTKSEKECVELFSDSITFTKHTVSRYLCVDKSFDDNDRLQYACFEPFVYDKKYASPICLVAHVDTVQKNEVNAEHVYKIKQKDIYDKSSYEEFYETDTGKVFDDRLGIGIIDIVINELFKNYKIRPYVILLGHEEEGCLGALELTNNYKTLENLFQNNNIQFLLEVDKSGSNNICFYELDYPDFERIFSPYYKVTSGSFSDISVLCPHFDIAGANVSAGYFMEHSIDEYATKDSIVEAMNALYNLIIDFQKYNGNAKYTYCDYCGQYAFDFYLKGLYNENN